MKLDLHLHTNASDGAMTPDALVSQLKALDMEAFAVTDHDTMAGVPEAARAAGRLGMRMIPGVELSTGGQVEIHVLGYFSKAPESIQARLSELQRQRADRLHAMLERLNLAGVELTLSDLPLADGGAPGRVHVARALVSRGVASSVGEAFKRFLVPGRPGFVPREKLSTEAGIRLIHQGGGAAVLAHPGIIQADFSLLPQRIRALKAMGLDGVEVYHPRHTGAQAQKLNQLARQEGLLVTGGSDYHGLPGSLSPGDGMAQWICKDQDYHKLLSKIGLES